MRPSARKTRDRHLWIKASRSAKRLKSGEKNSNVRMREDERDREKAAAEKAATRERFKESFVQLSQQSDPQARGYMLERFLNDFLAFEG